MTASPESLAKAREICKIDFFEMWGKKTWTFDKGDLDVLVNEIANALDDAKQPREALGCGDGIFRVPPGEYVVNIAIAGGSNPIKIIQVDPREELLKEVLPVLEWYADKNNYDSVGEGFTPIRGTIKNDYEGWTGGKRARALLKKLRGEK